MRINKLLTAVYIALCCISAFSCKKSSDDSPAITKDVVLPPNGTEVVTAHNKFALDFFRSTLEKDKTSSNKLVSPLSIYLAVSMVYNGSNGVTKDGIQQTLRLNNPGLEDLNKTCQALVEQIPEVDNKVDVSVANAIFYKKDIPPVPAFLTTINQFYKADITSLDFASSSALNTINKWASDHTHQRINKIIDAITPYDLMYLLNAVYFKGKWKYPFDSKKNQNNPFYLADGSTVTTTFMSQHVNVNYFRNDLMQMVEMPYGGGNFNMYVLLPAANVSVDGLLAVTDAASFQDWKSQVRKYDFDLVFPKFKFSYAVEDMRPHLAGMGMGMAFTDYADFSKMYTIGEVSITKAVHKTFIEVNEEGTEAAAVTAIGIGVTSAPPPSILRADHPFVFVIAEKSSGAIMFTGLLNNPSTP